MCLATNEIEIARLHEEREILIRQSNQSSGAAIWFGVATIVASFIGISFGEGSTFMAGVGLAVSFVILFWGFNTKDNEKTATTKLGQVERMLAVLESKDGS